MPNALQELSQSTAGAAERAAAFVASIQGHPRFASSALLWEPGTLVTSDHTLAEVETVEAMLPAGPAKAQLAGRDRATGIAVFRADHSQQAPVAATAAPRPGTIALVVGRSARLGHTAAMGVVAAASGPWRTWHGGTLDQHIQLDISLFPSSNGGAVVNAEGELIGMASSAFSRFGALAIPCGAIRRVVGAILSLGHVPRGFLGVGLREVPLPGGGRSGLMILTVEPGSSAAHAGLLMGDVLLAIDDHPLEEAGQLQSLLGPDSPGAAVTARIIRAGQEIEVPLVIGQKK